MSEPNESAGTAATLDVPQEKPKKVFKLSDVRRSVPVKLHLPDLYPGIEPFEFQLRMKLSHDAEERRQEYLGLAASEQTTKEAEQNLDELCDLMTETPKGFSDLKDTGQGPGDSFKAYVLNADPEQKEFLFTVVRGAIMLYWRKISPQEFRRKV